MSLLAPVISRSIAACVTLNTRPCRGDSRIIACMNSTLVRANPEPPRMSLRGDVIVANRGLLRIEEAAQWLGVGRTKAYELVHGGALPSVTIGRSRRILVSALEAFVEQLAETGGVT